MEYITALISSIALSILSFLNFTPYEMFATRPAEPISPYPTRIEVLFAGDIMLDRTVRTAARTHSDDFLFSCLDPLFLPADLVVANLEGPITDNPSISESSAPGDDKNFTFTFPTTTAALLYRHNIRAVNLGNNHILNFGWDGVRSTREYLMHAEVGYFGDPTYQSVAHREEGLVRMAFINYNEFAPHGFGSVATTTAQIRAARAQGYLPLVFTHWGEEYLPATEREKFLGHAFIDAGAEMVIGSHPHIVQEHEIYAGKNIYYSLGNLIFDQYWSDEVRHGLVLRASITPQGVVLVEEIPVELEHDRRTCPLHK